MPNSKKDFLRLSNTSAFSSITLAENKSVPKEVQILKVGTFKHPSYGKFEITTQTLSEMKKNFDDRVRGIDVAFDYFHDSDREASAWPQALELRENGTELWAVNVEWTPKAEKMLAERELRYFSPDFAFQWEDPESGVKHKNVLFGGALTNRPFLKEMQAIVADEGNANLNEPNKGEQMELDQLKAQVADLTKAMGERDATIVQMKADNAKLLSEKEESEKKVKLAEKETKFNVMLSEGKACPAQKQAFIDGNMEEFVKLAQPLNTKGTGSSENSGTEGAEEKNAKILKFAEEKKKANPQMSYGDAVSAAKKEIEKSEKK
jgi:hypothetical protein